MRRPLDARLSHLRPLGRRPVRTSTSCRSWPMSRAGSPADATCCSRSLACPPTAGAIRPARQSGSRRNLACRGAGCGGLHRTSACGVAAGRLRGRDALVLHRLRLSHLESPPLDLAVHERSFGLWRADGSPKPSVAVVEAFAGARRLAGPDDYPWIDLEPEEFLLEPNVALPRLYARYRMSERAGRSATGVPVSAPADVVRRPCGALPPACVSAPTEHVVEKACRQDGAGPRVESCSPRLLASRAIRAGIAGLRPGFWPQGQYPAP